MVRAFFGFDDEEFIAQMTFRHLLQLKKSDEDHISMRLLLRDGCFAALRKVDSRRGPKGSKPLLRGENASTDKIKP